MRNEMWEWEDWFAWHPAYSVTNKRWYWLKRIQRRNKWEITNEICESRIVWEYRL